VRASCLKLAGVARAAHGGRLDRYPAARRAVAVALRYLDGQAGEEEHQAACHALADVLATADCDDAALLGHLRGPGPHARGCWALDLILGLE
jgi:hypothetical protein